jgi:hypothetical protein
MPAVRRFCLGSSLLVLSVVGCDRSQPLDPAAQPLFRTTEAPSSTNAVAVSAGDSAPSDPVTAMMCFVGMSEDGWYVCIG